MLTEVRSIPYASVPYLAHASLCIPMLMHALCITVHPYAYPSVRLSTPMCTPLGTLPMPMPMPMPCVLIPCAVQQEHHLPSSFL